MARKIEEMGVGFTAWTSDFPLVLSAQTSSGGYTASHLLVISLRLKRRGIKPNAYLRLEEEYVALPPLIQKSIWCGA